MDTIDPRSWAERVAEDAPVDIRPVPEGRRGMTPGKSMLYPSPRVVNEAIRALPEGATITPKELRALLAERYDTYYTCPVTTTNSLRVVAEAANEAVAAGASLDEVTPVWRSMEAGAPAWRKLSFDPSYLQARRGN
jgi:hypothetical protein